MIGVVVRIALVFACVLLPSIAHARPRWETLPLPPAFRACSILVIEIFSLVMRECCPLNPGKNPSFLLLVEV